MLEDAIEGGLTEIKTLPDIGKYPSPKTKKEAKLFRVMSVSESEKNIFEVTGLEYNASKFDV